MWTISILGHHNTSQTATFITKSKADALYAGIVGGMRAAKGGDVHNAVVEVELEGDGSRATVDCAAVLAIMSSPADPVLSATLHYRQEQLELRAKGALEKFRALNKQN